MSHDDTTMMTRDCRFDFNVHYPEMAVLMFILKELKEGLGYGRKDSLLSFEEIMLEIMIMISMKTLFLF